MKTMTQEDLQQAREGSWYTILGAGGDLDQWKVGYEQALTEDGIGTPTEWFVTTGSELNRYLKPTDDRDWFPADLTVLMFPLEGLNIGKLAMFKIAWQDRWFDDVVDNTRSRSIA